MDISIEEWFKAMRLDEGMSAEIEVQEDPWASPAFTGQENRFTDKRECSVRRRTKSE